MRRMRKRVAGPAMVVTTLAGLGALVLSALAPAAGAGVTDADYGRSAMHCIKIDNRKSETGTAWSDLRNTCYKELTLFWCEPGGSDSVTKCGGRDTPDLGIDDVGSPVHDGNRFYAQGWVIKPLETTEALTPKNGFRYAACFGSRAGAEWFTSSRSGHFQCHPRRSGEQSGQEQAVRRAQDLLNQLGYDAGPVDGIVGRRTTAAVKRFQSASGMTADGRVTGSLVSKLGAAVAAGKEASAGKGERAPAGKPKDLWGSIAFSRNPSGGYTWAMVWNSGGRERAERYAVERCRARGGEACRDIGWWKNQCAALAVGDGSGFAGAGGLTKAKAEVAALSKCRAVARNCRVEVSRCTDTATEAGGVAKAPAKKAESAVVTEPKCRLYSRKERKEKAGIIQENCWMEVSNIPGCQIFRGFYREEFGGELDADHNRLHPKKLEWSGKCVNGVVEGAGELTVESPIGSRPWSYSQFYKGGKRHELVRYEGKWMGRWCAVEGRYVNGLRQGEWNKSCENCGGEAGTYRYVSGKLVDCPSGARWQGNCVVGACGLSGGSRQ